MDTKATEHTVRALVISGSMGSGKTTVLGEASDLLAAHGVPHAAIDLDAISTVLLPEPAASDVSLRNVAAVYSNVVAAGITRILLAEAVESRERLQQLRQAMRHAEFVVCRLTAGVETMQDRLRIREPGVQQERFLARSLELHETLESARLEDFVVSNDGRNITEVAEDLLRRASWVLLE